MECYIIFAGIIEQNFAIRLDQAINNAKNIGATKIIILFSSLGGNIQEGFTIAFVIQNSTIPISIHANNNIDSGCKRNFFYHPAKEQ